jgi:phosphatidylserine decarboxylase
MYKLLAWPFVLLQVVLPKHFLTALVFRVAAIRSRPIKDFLIRHFVNIYKVDVEEAALPVPEGYPSFNDFFTRQLVDGARPIDSAADTIVSPVDGTVSAAGKIISDMLLQAKGVRYSLSELLMTDIDDVDRFNDGSFATLYLAPHNYHRVHCPLDASLVAARYVPGALYSVNAATVSLLPGLFTRNERLVFYFDSDRGPMILIFVGALHVGSISTPWTGQIRPRRKGVMQDIDIGEKGYPRNVNKGDLLGWFNMGSTVILLLPPDSCELSSELGTGQDVRMGQAIGRTIGQIEQAQS